jgi:deoxyuridine 5'-triphosphate nucleotidohydrolase
MMIKDNQIILIAKYPELLPQRKTVGSACLDLCVGEDASIEPWKIKVIWAWIKTVIPQGWHSKVYIRSWAPTKQGLILANATAIFDADYRGEYLLQLWNITGEALQIEKGTRVAQIEFCPTYIPELGQYGTAEVPSLELIIDPYQYDNLDTLYPTIRWIGALHSTGK